MTRVRLALTAAFWLAVLHLLTVRVAVLPGVTVPIAAIVLGAEVATVAVVLGYLVGQLGRFRSSGQSRTA